MESSQSQLFTKKFVRVKVRSASIDTLKTLSQRMSPGQRRAFDVVYGKILSLAMIEVSPSAVYSLVQYYDQPLRCFTFKGFQLAPTVEEFEKILGCPIGERKPYLFPGHYCAMSKVSGALGIPEQELVKKKLERNGVAGFPRSYLEKKASEMADGKDWKSFMAILALLVFRVVLFPKMNGIIDDAATDAFLALHYRKESHVVAILADLYLAFDLAYTETDSKMFCCFPALYIWLVTQVFVHSIRASCPYEDFRTCEGRNKVDWGTHLSTRTSSSIRWLQKWKEVSGIICECKGFPNVPLMGTKGAINYNPILAMRQLGYSMKGQPPERALTPFLTQGYENRDILEGIQMAWKQPIRKDSELRKRDINAIGTYGQWLEDRVQLVKLPLHRPKPRTEIPTVEPQEEDERVKSLVEELEKTKAEKEKLKSIVTGVRKECQEWRESSTVASQLLESEAKRAKGEEEARKKYQGVLRGTSKELGLRRAKRDNKAWAERDKATAEVKLLKEKLASRQMDEETLEEHMEIMQYNMLNVIQRFEEQVAKERQALTEAHERALRKEQIRTLQKESELEGRTTELERVREQLARERQELAEREDIIQTMYEEGTLWSDRFATMLRGGQHLPELVKRAEQMADALSTPVKVRDLFGYCQYLIDLMKDIVKRR